MADKMLLTDSEVRALPFAGTGQYKVRDTELAGFLRGQDHDRPGARAP